LEGEGGDWEVGRLKIILDITVYLLLLPLIIKIKQYKEFARIFA